MFPNITGFISDIVKVLPTPGSMVIIPLSKETPLPIPALLPPFVVQFNPELYTENTKYDYYFHTPPGSSSAELKYNRIRAKQFNFNFLIDGTGATGQKKEVQAEIEILKNVIAFDGEKHRPRTLLVLWGTYYAMVCISKIDVKYTLFRKNGTPLRAELDITFTETTPLVLQNLIQGLLSPDLTSRRKVDAGDTLPLMCYKIYDDSRYYMEVAKANGITNFRDIQPGVELDFPAIAKR